ncbi:hypothetical protein ON010_g10335 [Phytophthora cinnamomi]|nr:hypothetical protein ON010_g10335 [Phytophthora cinnamomi]
MRQSTRTWTTCRVHCNVLDGPRTELGSNDLLLTKATSRSEVALVFIHTSGCSAHDAAAANATSRCHLASTSNMATNYARHLERLQRGEHLEANAVLALCERVNGVGINFVSPEGTPYDLHHGGGGGDGNTLTLGEGEYVTGIEAHWGEYHSHTRVRFIEFTTNMNHSICGGTRATKIGADHADPGYQLGGFFGTDGVELDSVGAIWTRISTAPVTPAPVTPAPVTPAPVTPAPVTQPPVTPSPTSPGYSFSAI